jgi:hypothetical protein
MWSRVYTITILLVAAYLLYDKFRGNYHDKTCFTNYVHSHVFDRSVEAYESQNATFALMKVYQAQAALEVLVQVAGGDAPFSSLCGDVHAYRDALYEQLQYYNSLHS